MGWGYHFSKSTEDVFMVEFITGTGRPLNTRKPLSEDNPMHNGFIHHKKSLTFRQMQRFCKHHKLSLSKALTEAEQSFNL